MLVSKNNFVPVVFPPGAGGHFFWQLLSIHPNIMPMGKDQTMQKLFNILSSLVYRSNSNMALDDDDFLEKMMNLSFIRIALILV